MSVTFLLIININGLLYMIVKELQELCKTEIINIRYVWSGNMKRIVVKGQMDNSDGTFESANRVYDGNKAAPTIPTCGGGGIEPKVIKKWKSESDKRQNKAISR